MAVELFRKHFGIWHFAIGTEKINFRPTATIPKLGCELHWQPSKNVIPMTVHLHSRFNESVIQTI